MTRASNANRWALLLLAVSLSSLLVLAAAGCSESGPSADDLTTEASRLQPPDDWKLVEESAHGSKRGCIDIKCPSLHRYWRSTGQTSIAALQDLMTDVGWEITKTDGTCVPDPRSFWYCEVVGRTPQGWEASLHASGQPGDKLKISLDIDP